MQDIAKNKLFLIVIAFMAVNVFVFFGGNIIVNRAADKVIEKLQKEYSPSPYGPGVDADKISREDVELPRESPSMGREPIDKPDKAYFSISQSVSDQDVQLAPTLQQMTKGPIVWRDDWEKERGFNN